jgi:hypothetical protein
MADFTPKKVSGETGRGITPKAEGSMDVEHESPPVMHLEAHHIGKLFGSKMPPIGSKIKVHGLVHVGAFNEGSAGPPSGGKAKGGEGHTKRSMTLHFHKMDMGTNGPDTPGSEVEQQEQSKKGAKAEMDKALRREAGHDQGLADDDSSSTPRGSNGPGSVA